MFDHCSHLEDLLNAEKIAIAEAIKEDKWYLSEKAKYDVGWKLAERHFLENYLMTWAGGYKSCYCQLVCKNGKDCLLNKYRK